MKVLKPDKKWLLLFYGEICDEQCKQAHDIMNDLS